MPDVFGGTRRQVEAACGPGRCQRFQLEATYLTLTANVVAAAVQEASLRGQIAATEEIIKIETESLALLRTQFELGQVAGADVAAQRSDAGASAGRRCRRCRSNWLRQRDLLAALIGRFSERRAGREVSSLPRCNCRRTCR